MSNKDIKIRLKDDPTPLELVRYFDFVVVNHEGEEQETVSKILNFVHSAQEKNKNRERVKSFNHDTENLFLRHSGK